MSLRLGNNVIAGVSRHTKSNSNPLLSFRWFDHIVNSMEWLRADTFSWQSGDVYTSVYNLLVSEYQNGTEETEGNITFKRSPNGYKITTDESGVSALFNETGVAWYYILDIENRRFKLPRTKYGFTGLRDGVGNYVPESLPNIRGDEASGREVNFDGISGAFTQRINTSGKRVMTYANNTTSTSYRQQLFDASSYSSTYQDNAPVQQRATQMYLYFYVGEFSQTAIEQTAGITTEVLNNKADTTLSNINASASAKEMIVGWGMPDYTAGISRTSGTQYTADTNGYIMAQCFHNSTSGGTQITCVINGVTIPFTPNATDYGRSQIYLPIKKGDIYKITANNQIYFFPYRE